MAQHALASAVNRSGGFCVCRPPLILPFYHSGVAEILPKGSVIPRPGTVLSLLHPNVMSCAHPQAEAPFCETCTWKVLCCKISVSC